MPNYSKEAGPVALEILPLIYEEMKNKTIQKMLC